MRRARVLRVTAIVVMVSLTAPVCLREAHAQNESEALSLLDLLPQAMSIIRNNYMEPVDTKTLIYGALRGMVGALDRESQFLPPKEELEREETSEPLRETAERPEPRNQFVSVEDAEEMGAGPKGEFGGLGIEITKRKGFVTVVSTFTGTPGYHAGLKPGDRIVKINEETLHTPDLNDVVSKLRGKPATKVDITVLRGEGELKRYTLTRQVVKVPSVVEARIVEDSIGYVKVTQFQERTPVELHDVLSELESQGMDALVFDLRDNPGGLLSSAVKVADLFLPGGHVIVSTKGRRPGQSQEYGSEDAGTHPEYPMAVLINGASAKGAEIVAGAIKDLKRGVLVGEKTYGSGVIQSILKLRNGSAIRLTTAKWYTPNGVCIHGKGVEPDVVVKVTPEQEMKRRTQKYKELEKALQEAKKPAEETPEEEKFVDIQLQEAVNILKALKAILPTEGLQGSSARSACPSVFGSMV